MFATKLYILTLVNVVSHIYTVLCYDSLITCAIDNLRGSTISEINSNLHSGCGMCIDADQNQPFIEKEGGVREVYVTINRDGSLCPEVPTMNPLIPSCTTTESPVPEVLPSKYLLSC